MKALEIIKRAKKTHKIKYDYSLVLDAKTKEKIKIICPTHGEFEVNCGNFINGCECKKCANREKKTTDKFIEDAKKVHEGKYDYSLVNYKGNKIKIKIICPIHGEFEQKPLVHLRGSGCPKCATEKNSNNIKITTSDFVKKAKIKFGNKYSYEKTVLNGISKKIIINCSKHGDVECIARNFLENGCPLCNIDSSNIKRKTATNQFIKKAKEVHGDKYDYSLTECFGLNTKVKIICPIHGEFEQIAKYHLQGCGCQTCSESKGERKIRFFLKNSNIHFFQEYKFKDCKDINPLPYDFYIPSKNILIEYNGEQHYKFPNGFHKTYHDFLIQKHHDWLKRKYAKDNGYIFLEINYQNFLNIETILEGELKCL